MSFEALMRYDTQVQNLIVRSCTGILGLFLPFEVVLLYEGGILFLELLAVVSHRTVSYLLRIEGIG